MHQLRAFIVERGVAPELVAELWRTRDALALAPLPASWPHSATDQMETLHQIAAILMQAQAQWSDAALPIEQGLIAISEPMRAAFAALGAQCWLVDDDHTLVPVGSQRHITPHRAGVARAAQRACLTCAIAARTLTGGARVVAFPLVRGDQSLGALTIVRAAGPLLTADERRLGTVIAALVTHAVIAARAGDHLRYLENVIEALSDGIVIKDRQLHPFMYNQAALNLAMNRDAILEARVRGEPPPTPIWDTSRPGGAPIEATDLPSVRAIVTGETLVSAQMEVRPDPDTNPHHSVPILVTATTLRQPDGEVNGAVVTLHDISPVMDVEKAKETFFHRGLHDLRNLLTVFKVATDYNIKQTQRVRADEIAPAALAAELAYWGERMARAMARAEHMIEELHDPGRFITGQMSRMSLFAFVQSYLYDLIKDYGRERIIPVYDAADTRLEGYWCRQDIESIIKNLIENALKYSPEDQPIQVQLYAKRNPSGKLVACFVVQDYGFGIVRDDLDRIFEHGYRSQWGKPEGIQGTGMGLHFCAQTVKAYAGRLWADSKGLGKGSTFYLELPLIDDAPGDE